VNGDKGSYRMQQHESLFVDENPEERGRMILELNYTEDDNSSFSTVLSSTTPLKSRYMMKNNQ
jgi:hypothetical protein